jgi:hypothetical protein
VLLGINLYGLTTGYSAPAGIWRPAPNLIDRRLLHEDLSQRRDETDPAYFNRLAREVHDRMGFYWSSKADRVMLGDNWILHLAGYAWRTYRTYEFTEADRALARGYGICSQYSNIVADVLENAGFSPRNVLYPHHSFVAVRSRSGRDYVVDPLFGVTIPKSLEAIRRHPSSVAPYYAGVLPGDSPSRSGGASLSRTIVRVFSGAPMAVNTGSVTPHTAVIEPIAYDLKWGIPAAAIGLGLCLEVLRRRRRAR